MQNKKHISAPFFKIVIELYEKMFYNISCEQIKGP